MLFSFFSLAINRSTFLEAKGVQMILQICKTTGLFPQDVIIEAASVLTTCCTKGKPKKLSLFHLLLLFFLFFVKLY